MMNEWRRQNGWSWPPSPRQICCWFVIFFVLPLTAFMFIPLHVVYAPLVISIAAVWIIILIIMLTTIDPAYSQTCSAAKPTWFDAAKHSHVIENLYCNVCQIHVDRIVVEENKCVNINSKCITKPLMHVNFFIAFLTAINLLHFFIIKTNAQVKHCRQCNKCIEGFDHHCKWLNNCIGVINYKWFIILMLSVSSSSLAVSSGFIILLVFSWTNSDLLVSRERMPMGLPVWTVCCSLLCIAYTAATFSSGNLLFFHYKLWKAGLTTYAFLKLKNRESDNKTVLTKEEKQRNANHCCTRGSCLKSSKKAVGDFSPPRISLATITPLPEASIASN